jgi:serine/threonine protein kinase
MDYINGDSLAKRVLGHPMDNATTLKYMNQICQALKYIHDRHILHLDIKPSNILFRNNNELVLTDFGISKQYAQEDGAQTRSTHIGISSGYAPLELYSKGSITQFTPATDIYSLGATLYTIVTGKIPPDANEIYEDGLDEFSDKVSPAIQNAIIKAMDPRRKQRPQSIDEFTKILNS